MTRARDHLLGIVGGLGGGVKICEKIKPEVRESLREEIESHKNINDSHASKKKKSARCTHETQRLFLPLQELP